MRHGMFVSLPVVKDEPHTTVLHSIVQQYPLHNGMEELSKAISCEALELLIGADEMSQHRPIRLAVIQDVAELGGPVV